MHHHMKPILAALAAAGLSAAIGATASAADFPAAPVYAKVPLAPAYNWSGCYAGVHGGGGIIGTSFTDDFPATNTHGGGGPLFGGQLGCNYQAGQLVFGLEGEGAWSGITDRFHETNDGDETVTARNRWDADLAVRVGFAIDRALVYGKAGAAFGSFDFREVVTTRGFTQTGQSTNPGLLLGAGLEYGFAPNWTAKLEYNVIDFVAKDVSFSSTDQPFIKSESATKQIVKLGVNYRFGN